MPHHCTNCELTFEVDAPPARCPSCMRLSTVSPVERTASSGRPILKLILVLLILTAVALGGAFLLSRDAPPAEPPPGGAAAAHAASERLTQEEALLLLALRHASGAASVARHKLGDRDGADAARTLSHLIQGRLGDGTLRHVDTPPRLRRATLGLPLLADGSLSAIFEEGRAAHLYPDELTLLLWAIAVEAELTADIVWIEPVTPDLDHWPATALRVRTSQGWLAIDPFTGALQSADHLTPGGPEQILSALAIIDAREALARHALTDADDALTRAARLTPDLWSVHALRAELALARGDLPLARSLVEELPARADHPHAWVITARVESTDDAARLDPDALIQRYHAIVEAFPFETRLCVALGDMLREASRFREAWDAYELALTRDPNVAGAHTGLALLYALADPPRALQHLHAELAEHTDHAPAYLALAFVHTLRGAHSDAERVARQGRKLTSDPLAYDAHLERLMRVAREE